jgi:hypothetical protein
MRHYPRTVAAIAAASLFAAFAAQANKGAEYKPHHHHKEHHKNFFITGGATYLEPSFNGLDYLDVVNGGTATTETIEPEFGWGYYIAAGYRNSHHYDEQANWAQYNSNISDSTALTSDGTTSATTSNQYSEVVPAGVTFDAHSKQNIDYSVLNANLGQYHNITEMLRTRLFAGIQYAKVDATTENTYSATGTALIPVDKYTSKFSAVGPEVGLDLEYKIWHTFGVVGHLGAAFLVGKQEASSNVYNDDFGSQVAVNAEDVARLIPAMDAKLGVNWNVPYEYDRFSFGIEAGYQIAYYWDVIDQVQFPGNSDAVEHNYSNYGNMGPYLNLTAMF